MRRALVISIVVLSLFMLGCSSGKGGSARPGDPGYGEGNIPLAEAEKNLRDIHFAFDSSALDTQARDLLRQNAQWIADNSGLDVTVEGHCDERGTAEYNLALGERRASSVKEFLRSLGVEAERLATISYGEELPLDPGHSEDAWSKNRRAHFTLK